VDELLVSGLGSVALWFWLERRALASPGFSSRVTTLRLALDRAYFRTSRAVTIMEEIIAEAAVLQPNAFAAWLSGPEPSAPDPATAADLEALRAAIEDRIYAVSALKSARALAEPGADRASLLRKIRRSSARSELPLLLAYARSRSLAGHLK
jgi:hypothetical protein